MKCQDFETLMADALGNELAPADQPIFEEHLAQCDACRHEYATACETLATMRRLPGPEPVTLHDNGARLGIEDAPTGTRRPLRGAFRYAASGLIAFTAGYALHAGWRVTRAGGLGGPIRHRPGGWRFPCTRCSVSAGAPRSRPSCRARSPSRPSACRPSSSAGRDARMRNLSG